MTLDAERSNVAAILRLEPPPSTKRGREPARATCIQCVPTTHCFERHRCSGGQYQQRVIGICALPLELKVMLPVSILRTPVPTPYPDLS